MGDFWGPDLISDLPQSIIESILVRLPIRDAVRTSILSSKWRYKWNSITKIVVDEKCVPPSNDRTINEKSLLKFVNQLLFLHQGPIHKFQITNSDLQSCPEIDQWILFLSRNDLKELVLELGEGEWFRIPSCLFNCRKLIRLELFRWIYVLKTLHFWFLGGVPNLERLAGHIYFTKYLSIGNDPGKLPVTYRNLETVELFQVSFEDMKEILVVLRLITSSPNLKELQISGSSNIPTATDAPDLEFWSKECPSDCTLKQLKVVKLTDMCGVPHEMELIKFLLANSPVLETMSIVPCMYMMESQLKMLIELVRFRRASARAEIVFVRE
ncbi:hypothetical protein K1719_027985 [Acacia pycnantha]|nr:hypothetical protein K1719_044556 [Acacia pycnantha]KAI9092050.1 hypothetical protein K1719_027985 [Acacia pycnantha]